LLPISQTYHSPLGVFLRKVHLAYRVLNFPQSLIVRQDVLSWCAGDPEPSSGRVSAKKPAEKAEESSEPRSTDSTRDLASHTHDHPEDIYEDLEDEKRWDGHGGIGFGYSMKKGKRRVVANSESEVGRA
jgi:hypothetical protein